MKEEQVTKAYAKSLIELGEEHKVDVALELTKFNVAINECNDLESLMFLDVFTIEEKGPILKVVMDKLKLSNITQCFVNFLLQEKRIGIFPMIFKEIIVIDDYKKGFIRGVIEGPDKKIGADFKKKLSKYLKEQLGKDAELEYKNNSEITAGYRVTVGDYQLDASLENQLDNFKKSILEK